VLDKSREDARGDAWLWQNQCDGDAIAHVAFDDGQAYSDREEDEYQEMMERDSNVISTGLRAFSNILNQGLFEESRMSRSGASPNALKMIEFAENALRDFYNVNREWQWKNNVRTGDFYNEIQQSNAKVAGIANCTEDQVNAYMRAERARNQEIIDQLNGFPSSQSMYQSPLVPTGSETLVGSTTIEMGENRSYTSVATEAVKNLSLNKLQAQIVMQISIFLEQKESLSGLDSDQMFLYVGGAGDTGKSRVIDAIREVFSKKNCPWELLLTAPSGSAAVKINGLTIHSALGINERRGSKSSDFNLSGESGGTALSEKTLNARDLFQKRKMLVIDEISMVSGDLLAQVSEKCKYLSGSNKDFGSLAVVLVTGDFYQFEPVTGLSLLQEIRNDTGQVNKNAQNTRDQTGRLLFKKFTEVVMLQKQVRSSGCAILTGFLTRLRQGKQTSADFKMLQERTMDVSRHEFHPDLRYITPVNRSKFIFCLEAAIQFARTYKKHLSIFLSHHTFSIPCSREELESNSSRKRKPISSKDTLGMLSAALNERDSGNIKIPPVFWHVEGVPVITTVNELPGLKHVNGQEFSALGVVVDPRFPGYAIAPDITIHAGPPAALLVTAKELKDLVQISCIPEDTIFIKPSRVPIEVKAIWKKWGRQVQVKREGLQCISGFAMTAHKAQGKTFDKILVDLKRPTGRIGGGESAVPFESLYVQLSRATSWEGIHVKQCLTENEFLQAKINQKWKKEIEKFEVLAAATAKRFQHICESSVDIEIRNWYDTWGKKSE
jgi:hypothetical protein